MKSSELRKKFINFFITKHHRHMPAAKLTSSDDPSVLFNIAGMQQFKRYYQNPVASPASRIVTIQPCIRTIDIDEVGDDTHLTFFEMMGNFAFDNYFKTDAIDFAWEFLTEELNISPDRIYATYFMGDGKISADQESLSILQNISNLKKIIPQSKKDNFWGPTGNEGPCGPTVEFYVDNIEVWNLVFNEFYQDLDNNHTPLTYKGVDTGMGMERILTVINQDKNVYQTDLFVSLVGRVANLGVDDPKSSRIICDHLKAGYFLISEGIRPKNVGREYILRKLLRRVMMHKNINDEVESIFDEIKSIYYDFDLISPKKANSIYQTELKVFKDSLSKGQSVLEKHIQNSKNLTGKDVFLIYSTYGIPLEAQKDYIKNKIDIDEKGFEEEFASSLEEHKNISRAGIEAKFGGHGITDEEHIPQEITIEDLQMVRMHHTATHMLQQALREVLGDHIQQKGSDISPNRLRFDFSHSEPLTNEERKKVEDLVNTKIKENLSVNAKLLSLEEARELGALAFFNSKYGDKVKVYFIGNSDGTAWSKEFCGGPHVKETGELKQFKILSEKSSSAGIRRIKAVAG